MPGVSTLVCFHAHPDDESIQTGGTLAKLSAAGHRVVLVFGSFLRRAVRHAWLLGRREPTLTPLTRTVVEQLGDVYPELVKSAKTIYDYVEAEVEAIAQTESDGPETTALMRSGSATEVPPCFSTST